MRSRRYTKIASASPLLIMAAPARKRGRSALSPLIPRSMITRPVEAGSVGVLTAGCFLSVQAVAVTAWRDMHIAAADEPRHPLCR
jgi:hypothetical protein